MNYLSRLINKKGKIGCSSLIGGAIIVFVGLVVVAMVSGNNSDIKTSSPTNSSSTSKTEAPSTPAPSKSETQNDDSENTETEAAEPEETETEYPKMNGFLIGDSQGKTDSYGCTVNGIVGNATGKNCSYVSITIGFYDKNGTKVASGIDNILNLASGETWKYTVIAAGSGIKSYKIEEIFWY